MTPFVECNHSRDFKRPCMMAAIEEQEHSTQQMERAWTNLKAKKCSLNAYPKKTGEKKNEKYANLTVKWKQKKEGEED